MSRYAFLATTLVALLSGSATAAEPAKRPNIVWIIVDDMSANFSCYGEKTIQTPHVDQMAKDGTRFSRAFVTAPVCSPCRSALITGCYQTTLGAHHHRSGRGVEKIHLNGPAAVPVFFKKAGYYTCIGGFNVKGKNLGKTDYNFEWDRSMYDGNDWSGRKEGQPFFMQVQLHGGKYRGGGLAPAWTERVKRELGSVTQPEDVKLPPYYPRDPVLLEDWARYLDCCRYTDKEVGDVIARLEKEKLLDNTFVFFMTDHGISHARGKQFLYDEGIHVPLVVRGPGIAKGAVRDDMVEHIDLAATSLALAGIEIPKWMQGRNIFAKDYAKRDAVFAARDRCDETVEHIRSVRTEKFKYIRNYLPNRPHLQPNRYKDSKVIVQKLRELHAAGKLNELQTKLLFSEKRPKEELYDLTADPFEVKNLANDPAHKPTLAAMQKKLTDWEEKTNDLGRKPEPEKMYDSDMAVYLGGKVGTPAHETLKKNIALMKQWAKEGK
ncbi:MAG: sulfatase-like hydrolase/transferase [Planctomycetia bacterium]|nr:sulfatase-like hydrolase/transferase [Planctomycetia bacterium]